MEETVPVDFFAERCEMRIPDLYEYPEKVFFWRVRLVVLVLGLMLPILRRYTFI